MFEPNDNEFRENSRENKKKASVASEGKFRAAALIITMLVCAGVVTLGIMYMNKIIDTTNAESVDKTNNVALDYDEDEPEKIVLAETTASTAAVSSASDNETTSSEAAVDTTAETAAVSVSAEDDFSLSAASDSSGLKVSWKYKGDTYNGTTLTLYMSDGESGYAFIAEGIDINSKTFSYSGENSENAVGLLVEILNESGDILLQKYFVVNNTTYAQSAQTTAPINLSALFN